MLVSTHFLVELYWKIIHSIIQLTHFKCTTSAYEQNCTLLIEKYCTMATHSSTPAWEIPWTEEPGRLQSMGSLRVGYDWATSLSLFTFMHWRRKWQPTPVCLPGESQGREPGGPTSMGLHRVGHDWCDLTAAAVSFYLWLFSRVAMLVLS